MSQTDISDVTAYTYTYLINGVTPDRGWVDLFKTGEKVRLRVINAAAVSVSIWRYDVFLIPFEKDRSNFIFLYGADGLSV